MQQRYRQVFRVAYDFLIEYAQKTNYSEQFFEDAVQRMDDLLHVMPEMELLREMLMACYAELDRLAGEKHGSSD